MTETYKSTCSYCGVGCGVSIQKNDTTGNIELTGDESHPASKGMLCSKGMNLHYTVMDKGDRLLYPEMRWNRSQPMKRVSWDTALDRASAVFKTLIKNYGPDSVGFYVSGQLLTEEYYIVNKITKGFFGTNNIDTNSRLCMSSAVVGYKKALGEDSVPVSYDDIELADCFFITGANPAWCHPIIFRRLEAHKQNNPEVKIIVVDPRKTQTAQMADIHLQIKPGTDIHLYNAIAKLLIENDWVDHDFIDKSTEGFEKVKEQVLATSIEDYANACGLTTEQIVTTTQAIHDAKGFISMWAMGLNQSVVGVNKNLALLNISLLTGHIGKPGSGPFSLTGQPNAMGGREVGGLSNMLAAHRDFSNPTHCKEVSDYWGVDAVPTKPGLTATQMFDSLLDGSMKAIWIICTNPVVSLPDARKIEAALRKAKFVVVQDISGLSDTVPFADLVLPAAGYMEKTGTMTNSDRRVSLVQKVVNAPGEALPDAEILWKFAHKMGWEKSFDYNSYEDIYDEHKGLTKGTNIDVSGVTYRILKEKGTLQWPFPEGAIQGVKRLFTDHQFYTTSKKAQLFGVSPENESEPLDDNFPLILTTGRIRDQWHTMTRTGKVNTLKQHIDKPYLEINPKDALSRGLQEGDLAEITSRRGNVRLTVKITENISKGVVFLPMHWGRQLLKDYGRANNLTNTLLDPFSKQPDFKYSAVAVKKFEKEQQKIVVIGAGAGANRFVEKYRELNPEDKIQVFSKEIHPFYNRVLLPEYISKDRDWESLLKLKEEKYQELEIEVNKGITIDKIDKTQKLVTDSNGVQHSYDTLVIATGSSAAKPPNFPKDKKHVYTLRNRQDADRLNALFASGKGSAVIVGGGLLGLELADSLNKIGVSVHLIQRSSRLMDRQLDTVSARLLRKEIEDKGIKIYFNDEVRYFEGEGSIKGVRLKSGQQIDCDALVYAIGTRPNIQIAQEAGLKCKRGVLINQQMQSSDPSIYCIGEIAEFEGQMWGITAAAEQQADVAAAAIYGDATTTYQGSLSLNILKVGGLQLCSIGIPEVPKEDGYEVVLMQDLNKRYYKKCIIKNDKLVGAILMGDKSEFGEFRELIADQLELKNKRNLLLRPGAGESRPVKGELVCSCNNVGEGNIMDACEKGCKDLDAVMKETTAGTGCGSCKPEVLAILDKIASVAELT